MHISISTIGGVIGLISGLFVLFDRFYKGRPVILLTVREIENSPRKLVCIRIKNTTAYDIAILGARNRQGIYFLTENEDVHSLMEGASGKSNFSLMLKPDGTKELIIKAMYKDNVALEVTKPGYVEFVIYWRRGNATWLAQMPLLVCSTSQVLRQLGGVEQ